MNNSLLKTLRFQFFRPNFGISRSFAQVAINKPLEKAKLQESILETDSNDCLNTENDSFLKGVQLLENESKRYMSRYDKLCGLESENANRAIQHAVKVASVMRSIKVNNEPILSMRKGPMLLRNDELFTDESDKISLTNKLVYKNNESLPESAKKQMKHGYIVDKIYKKE